MEVPTAKVTDITISPPQRWEAGRSRDLTAVQQGMKNGRYAPSHCWGF